MYRSLNSFILFIRSFHGFRGNDFFRKFISVSLLSFGIIIFSFCLTEYINPFDRFVYAASVKTIRANIHSGTYRGTVKVMLKRPRSLKKGSIHYTKNGKKPKFRSPLYKKPILVQHTSTIRAGFFKKKRLVSRILTIKIKIIPASSESSVFPNRFNHDQAPISPDINSKPVYPNSDKDNFNPPNSEDSDTSVIVPTSPDSPAEYAISIKTWDLWRERYTNVYDRLNYINTYEASNLTSTGIGLLHYYQNEAEKYTVPYDTYCNDPNFYDLCDMESFYPQILSYIDNIYSGKYQISEGKLYYYKALSQQIFLEINQERFSRGLSTLLWSDALFEKALYQASYDVLFDCSSHGSFSSGYYLNGFSPDRCGFSIGDPYNICTQLSSSCVFQWMHSSSHISSIIGDYAHIYGAVCVCSYTDQNGFVYPAIIYCHDRVDLNNKKYNPTTIENYENYIKSIAQSGS